MPGLGYYLQQHRGPTARIELGCVEVASCTMSAFMPAPYFLTRQKAFLVNHCCQSSPFLLLHLLLCRPHPFISLQHCCYKAVFLEGFQFAIISKPQEYRHTNLCHQYELKRFHCSTKKEKEESSQLWCISYVAPPHPHQNIWPPQY